MCILRFINFIIRFLKTINVKLMYLAIFYKFTWKILRILEFMFILHENLFKYSSLMRIVMRIWSRTCHVHNSVDKMLTMFHPCLAFLNPLINLFYIFIDFFFLRQFTSLHNCAFIKFWKKNHFAGLYIRNLCPVRMHFLHDDINDATK